MRSGIELELEEHLETIAQPPEMDAVVDALFARIDDLRQNYRQGIHVSADHLEMSCRALVSTVAVVNDQQRIDRLRDQHVSFRLDLGGSDGR